MSFLKKTSLMMASVFCLFALMTVSAGSAMAASKIAYVGGFGQIYVMNADGSNVTNISNNLFQDEDPSWSPDGSQIVFNSNRGVGSGIYVMDADGSNVTPLITDAATDFSRLAWSPELPASVASISPFGQFVIVFMLGGASALWMTRRQQAASHVASP